MAKAVGANEIINPMEEDPVERVTEITDGTGVDVVYDTTGNLRATEQGLQMLKRKIGGAGTLYLMGLYEHPNDNFTFNVSDLMHKAGCISAEWGRAGGQKLIEDVLSLMSQGRLQILKWITHKLPEDRADEAMMMLIEKRDNAIGVEIIH